MIRADEELEEMLADFFAAELGHEVVDNIERRGSWPDELWTRADRADIPWIGIAEDAGGVGGTLADAAAVIRHSHFHAAPLPLLEHHLGAHLLSTSGMKHECRTLSVAGLSGTSAPIVKDGRLTGELGPVVWAASVGAVAVLAKDDEGRDLAAVLDPAQATLTQGSDLAGTPTPSVRADGAPVKFGLVPDAEGVRRRAEVLRCAAIAGLLKRLHVLTSDYVAERHQFGKPIGAFQAVQIHSVLLAQAAAMSAVAVERAVSAVGSGAGAFETSAAAVVVDDLAAQAAAAAHQAHGAIGMTREYPLQQVTRRIHALRQLWTPTSETARRLGATAHSASSFAALVARHPEEGITVS